MLRRLASGVALASMAALVLVGCSPGPSEEELTAEARSTLSSFYEAADREFQRGEASASSFDGVATESFGADYASQIQQLLDDGVVSRGVPAVVGLELTRHDDQVAEFELCTDGRQVRTSSPDGDTTGALVAWLASFTTEQDELLLAELTLSGDQSVCMA